MNERGISPLIATVLIIGFVIIGSILVITFINNLTKEQLEETGETIETASANIDYEVSFREHYGGSKVQITNKANMDLYFLIQQEDQVIITELIPAYNTKTIIGNYSDQITITPMIEQNGENKSLGSHVKEKQIVPDIGNYALSFDGVDDYVGVLDDISFGTLSENFTVSAWIYDMDSDDGIDDDRVIITEGDEGVTVNNTFILKISNNKEISLTIGDGVSSRTVTATIPLIQDEWHYVTGTYDGSTISVYINGILSNAETTIIYPLYNPTRDLVIGRQSGGDCGVPYLTCWKGNIDEVRIWNKALGQSEIEQLYKNNIVQSEGLISYWNFNNDVSDSVGNNDGILFGDTQFIEVS
jgi:hypothetical protein